MSIYHLGLEDLFLYMFWSGCTYKSYKCCYSVVYAFSTRHWAWVSVDDERVDFKRCLEVLERA